MANERNDIHLLGFAAVPPRGLKVAGRGEKHALGTTKNVGRAMLTFSENKRLGQEDRAAGQGSWGPKGERALPDSKLPQVRGNQRKRLTDASCQMGDTSTELM